MTKFLPVFPLSLILFPGEEIQLHIFEPRYKELIQECIDSNITFGITPTMDEGFAEFGTEVELVKTLKVYDNGEMDVIVRGISAFKTLEYLETVPDKLYSAAIVAMVENDAGIPIKTKEELFQLLLKLSKDLDIQKHLPSQATEVTAFKMAKHLGLDIGQKMDLLSMNLEEERQNYLISHLKLTIPIVHQANKLQFRSFLN